MSSENEDSSTKEGNNLKELGRKVMLDLAFNYEIP